MSSQPFRWRTVLEIAITSIVIYFLIGSPGLPNSPKFYKKETDQSLEKNTSTTTKLESLVYPNPNLDCPKHNYTIHIFSHTPLIIYIENFLSQSESAHLLTVSAQKWQPSTIFNQGVEISDPSIRKSDKALIDRDEIVQCLEQRALDFQGWPQDVFVERLWTQRYEVGGHYGFHYDWATGRREERRVSSFMVYVAAEGGLEGGGTRFPRLERPRKGGSGRWCEFVECEDGDGDDDGVTFKARQGAAVFWQNFDQDGRGYKETIHAGLPVLKGVKVGLNIWSWLQKGHKPT